MERTERQMGKQARGQRKRRGKKGAINGIDTEQLFETIEAIKEDPSKAACQFFATTRWKRGAVSDTKISRYRLGGEDIEQDYSIATDEPSALLGSDSAPNPQMYLYTALNACVLNTFIVNASARGLRLDSVEIELEGELDLRGFLAIDETINPGYDELTLVCRVSGDGTRQEFEECLEAGTRYSPNFQSLTRPVKVNYRLETR